MKNTFTWGNFSIEFLKSIVYSPKTLKRLKPEYEINDQDLIAPYMDEICSFPNEKFVRKYRKEIEDNFLANSNSLIRICSKLESINYHGIVVGDNDKMLQSLKNLLFTSTVLNCYIDELRQYGKMIKGDVDSIFASPKTIDLSVAEEAEVSLFPYQEQAVNAMKKFYLEDNNKSGILVMPTGSGKTRTSVYFLLKEMVSQGYQVIWITHRAMLIEQAAINFYKSSPIILKENNSKEKFKMICISGKHSTVKGLEKDDDLIIANYQSLCQNTIYLPNILKEKVIIVVDEAHHTIAPSYKRIIKTIRNKVSTAKLLGLTATPVRLTDNATNKLMKIYDNNIIFSVSMSSLIADGTLANPIYIPRLTNIDIESIINIDERKFIEKWGEMPESLLEKVAKTNERNNIIVNEYINNKEKYGKTVIFALNGIHCMALNDEFRKKGIKSDFIYSLNKGNEEKIKKFQDGKIDVLININMLTEGSDIPSVETIFLTRPTSSDSLLMQMVGRGMRGVACGGTKEVNIVDFCDKWSSITKWLNPKFLFEDNEDIDEEPIYKSNGKFSLIPFDMIRDLIKGITYNGDTVIEKSPILPVGWYNVIDDDGNDTKILVFDSQLDGYKNFKKDMNLYINNSNVEAKDLLTKYFNGFGIIPKEYEIDYIIGYLQQESSFPELQYFSERNDIEPFKIATELLNSNLPFRAAEKRISEIYIEHREIIDNLYGSKEYYKRRIVDCMIYPSGMVPIGSRIEEVEKQFYNLSKEPINKSLDDLLDEVISENKENLLDNFIRPEICWTDKNYSTYFGVYYHNERLIKINSLLNSKDIPVDVIKFIIYHECLHQEFYGHTKEFRNKEHLYPNFQEYENFLEYKLKDYNIEYAM